MRYSLSPQQWKEAQVVDMLCCDLLQQSYIPNYVLYRHDLERVVEEYMGRRL